MGEERTVRYAAELMRLRAEWSAQGWSDIDGDRALWLWCQVAWLRAGALSEHEKVALAVEIEALCPVLSRIPQKIDAASDELRAVRTVRAWAYATDDSACLSATSSYIHEIYQSVEDVGPTRADLATWVEVLRLCGEGPAADGHPAVGLLAARAVAALMNDFFDVERSTFCSHATPGLYEEEDGIAAELTVQLDAVDALVGEAVRCCDTRLLNWTLERAQAMALDAEPGGRVAEQMRRIALRAWLHGRGPWTKEWIDRPWGQDDRSILYARMVSLSAACAWLD